MIAGDANTVQADRDRQAPEQIGHKNYAASQDPDHGQFPTGIIVLNFSGQRIQSTVDLRLGQ